MARNIYIVPYGRTYGYYPRYYYNPYAFGYGPAGRGHFYFDLHYSSYIWHPYSVYRNDSYGSYGYPIGELRLKVHPRDAQVFIDGYYAGRVDDFDGVFQSLRLEEGEYQVEIVLPGYEPLAFDVRIFPGEKTTYEGDLIPQPSWLAVGGWWFAVSTTNVTANRYRLRVLPGEEESRAESRPE